jgi:ADP-ribose pyrophosphatase YjhB (NUDIX family)
MIRILLRIWRAMPLWVHFWSARLIRPRFGAATAAVIFDGQGRILLFKHTYRKFEWGLPAGGLEYREQPADGIVREFFEETSMQIKVERLLTAVSAREDHYISLIYLCTIMSGEFKPSPEISEMKYFDLDEMPLMLSAEKELIRQVAREIYYADGDSR